MRLSTVIRIPAIRRKLSPRCKCATSSNVALYCKVLRKLATKMRSKLPKIKPSDDHSIVLSRSILTRCYLFAPTSSCFGMSIATAISIGPVISAYRPKTQTNATPPFTGSSRTIMPTINAKAPAMTIMIR